MIVKGNRLSDTISLKDTDVFKDMLEVVKEFIHDERIDKEVRQEYTGKLQGVIESNRSGEDGT